MVSTDRSLEDAFRLIRRIKFAVFADDRCVLLVCGGHTATSFLMAHSRAAAGPSKTQLLGKGNDDVQKNKRKIRIAA